jgi:hypothetical protein
MVYNVKRLYMKKRPERKHDERNQLIVYKKLNFFRLHGDKLFNNRVPYNKNGKRKGVDASGYERTNYQRGVILYLIRTKGKFNLSFVTHIYDLI